MISELQPPLPDISKGFLKPCLNSYHQKMQLQNLHLWMLPEVFSICRVMYVKGFHSVFFPRFANRHISQYSVFRTQHRAETCGVSALEEVPVCLLITSLKYLNL